MFLFELLIFSGLIWGTYHTAPPGSDDDLDSQQYDQHAPDVELFNVG